MKDLFSTQSKEYAQFRPTFPQALFDFILKLVDEKSEAWDCGTGNGQVAGVLAQHFLSVFATDISKRQIESAGRKDNIFYSVQPAEHTDFSTRQFDLITVAQAIHWFDFDAFYKEVRRTLKRHGILAVIGYGLMQTEGAVNKIIQHFYKDIIGPYWDKERRYLDEEYKTIPFPFKEIDVPLFQMEYHWSVEQLAGYLGTWSAVQHYKAQKKIDPIHIILPELKLAWGDEREKRFSFPVLLRVGRI